MTKYALIGVLGESTQDHIYVQDVYCNENFKADTSW